jgi:hypothetical protein
MPTFQNIINSIKGPQDCLKMRQDLIKEIEQLTRRRLLVYVADINKPESALKPEDKTGFSDLIQDIKEEEVDFLINSPGGFAEVTEAIVGMLRARFKSIRFAIPNMAKSAATLLVLSGDELLMDHRSELGPVDPQVEYTSIDGRKREAAEDILDGFKEAKEVLAKEGPAATPAYVPLLNKYTIGLLRGCRNAMQLSQELAETWLRTYMFAKDPGSPKPKEIAEFFAIHAKTLSHNRAILIDKCLDLGIKLIDLRKAENKNLAEKLWELWCLFELHFERTPVHKMYENSAGCSLQKQSVHIQIVPGQPPVLGQPQQPVPQPQLEQSPSYRMEI